MPRSRVIGLDISAKRIACACCDSVQFFGSTITKREVDSYLSGFVRRAYTEYLDKLRLGQEIEAHCIEINLHPKIIHKGHVAPNMVRAYMRSRWIEGAFLSLVGGEEPSEIKRVKGGHYKLDRRRSMYALAASWTPNAKELRRTRMTQIYGIFLAGITQDEVDALAIAHECAIAINLADRMTDRRRPT